MFQLLRFSFSTSKKITEMRNSYSNITPKIISLLDRKLLSIPNHPLAITKQLISKYFQNQKPTISIPQKQPKYQVIRILYRSFTIRIQ